MRDHLAFYINGFRHTVRGTAASRTLTDYLRGPCSPDSTCSRDSQPLTGTKVACAEGDCGACSVLVGKPSSDGRRLEYQTLDACIAFVFQLDRCHVVTVEGLANSRLIYATGCTSHGSDVKTVALKPRFCEPRGACSELGEVEKGHEGVFQRAANEAPLTAVQNAMVDHHGSQCGFCTPGFVMALHGLVEECSAESSGLSEDELRLGLSGNLCRCTGYSQILEAGLSLKPAAMGSINERFDTAAMLADFAKLDEDSVAVDASPVVFVPGTLEDLIAVRSEHPEATLVAGATDLGVRYNHGHFTPSAVIATTRVEELHRLEIVGDELMIGAAVPWSRVERYVADRLPEYQAVLQRFGSPQVRNAGTLAGNLANASPIADSIPLHYVTESRILLASASGCREIPIEKFYLGYKQTDLRPDEFIAAVLTPLPGADVLLKLYKISKRRDMDISTVTMAFWMRLSDGVVEEARLAAGGVGPTVVRLPQAERELVGHPLSLKTLRDAGRTAREEVTPISDVRGSAQHRLRLVENLFVKCYYDLDTSTTDLASGGVGR